MAISGSSSFSSIQHSDYSMGSQRLPIQDMLRQFFRGGAPQLVNELAWRLHGNAVIVQEVASMIQMLTLPEGIQLPKCRETSYEPVSQTRLLNILLHVTEFWCGVQQLVDLAALCARNSWHLCFLADDHYHNISESLTFSDHHNYDNMLYVCVPHTADNRRVQSQALNVAMLDQRGQLSIQRIRLLGLLGNDREKADGYCIGHELSHANANADWHASNPGRSNPHESETHFFNVIIQQIQSLFPNEDTSVIGDISQSFLQNIIRNQSEAMNLLKLGHDWNFNGSIIGEFDFLCEVKGNFCIRIPYALGEVENYPPKLITAFCTLIFKLKQQSITSQDLENLKNALQEYNSIQHNFSGIKHALEAANYEIAMVPQFFNEGSGGYYHTTSNSGFHAILEALNPTYSNEDDTQRLMSSMA
ncbi:MAG: hypothetical protein LBD69_02855 [Puniceicoccales bacterium]|jgi:hypothetical protein|nr:hypothetical protein [Puniceicoccales bacterium]